MRFLLRLSTALLLTAVVASAKITRELNRSFDVSSGTSVEVDIAGGPIAVEIGPDGRIEATLVQTVRTDSETKADETLARYEITLEQTGDRVRIAVRNREANKGFMSGWRGDRAQFSVRLVAPADAHFHLDTSGGAISVRGATTGRLHADTAGGSISVTGGSGPMNLDTSGGSISVQQALDRLRADTSGGSISIDYVGPNASDINADTSGGTISIGLDPAGGYNLEADTSGGSVRVTGLDLQPARQTRTHVTGRINGGGGRVRADTSGGSISIRDAKP